MSKIISVINQKGGVAKTTTVFNLANYYADKGYKVLAIDLDTQANLTDAFEVPETVKTVKDFFQDVPVEVYKKRDNLDIIPSDISFAGIEIEIGAKLNRELILLKSINPIIQNYEIILIDCPPALNVITINALSASDYALIPLKPSSFSYKGLSSMISFINLIRDNVNPKLKVLGIVLTIFDKNRVISKTTLSKLEEDEYSVGLLESKIRPAEVIVRAEEERKSIFVFDKGSNVAQDYKLLAEEILTKINK